ncbi:hypothetical protein LINGRAHAP2_LOCUS2379 [Linum grandiflorum]
MELVYPISLMGENYTDKLSRSIQDVADEFSKATPNLSQFIQPFYDLLQSKLNPPLEAIWVYSALSYYAKKEENQNEGLSDRLATVKELFQLISACSGPCSSSTSIALLAPVASELHKLVTELLSQDLEAKRVKKLVRNVQSLIGSVLGYVAVCAEATTEEEDSNLIVKLADLVGIWMDGKEELKSFFPLLNDQVRREIGLGGFTVIQLAGAVTLELFLLKLCFDLRIGNRGAELDQLEKQLKSWIVGSITGFRSFYFFDILVRVLLDPILPVASLLKSQEEILLRSALYDAVILVEYSFLSPGTRVGLAEQHFISLGLKRLVLSLEAIEFFRKEGKHKRAISYSTSFASSRLAFLIIKHVTSQIGMEEEAGRLEGSSPKALLRWLFSLEGQGVRIFDESISKTRVKFALDLCKAGDAEVAEGNKMNSELMFYIDNKGEMEVGGDEEEDKSDKEMNESMTAAFMAAAHSITTVEGKGKKRKEGPSAGRKKRTKLVLQSDNSDSDLLDTDDPSSASEVENPTSDEDA